MLSEDQHPAQDGRNPTPGPSASPFLLLLPPLWDGQDGAGPSATPAAPLCRHRSDAPGTAVCPGARRTPGTWLWPSCRSTA